MADFFKDITQANLTELDTLKKIETDLKELDKSLKPHALGRSIVETALELVEDFGDKNKVSFFRDFAGGARATSVLKSLDYNEDILHSFKRIASSDRKILRKNEIKKEADEFARAMAEYLSTEQTDTQIRKTLLEKAKGTFFYSWIVASTTFMHALSGVLHRPSGNHDLGAQLDAIKDRVDGSLRIYDRLLKNTVDMIEDNIVGSGFESTLGQLGVKLETSIPNLREKLSKEKGNGGADGNTQDDKNKAALGNTETTGDKKDNNNSGSDGRGSDEERRRRENEKKKADENFSRASSQAKNALLRNKLNLPPVPNAGSTPNNMNNSNGSNNPNNASGTNSLNSTGSANGGNGQSGNEKIVDEKELDGAVMKELVKQSIPLWKDMKGKSEIINRCKQTGQYDIMQGDIYITWSNPTAKLKEDLSKFIPEKEKSLSESYFHYLPKAISSLSADEILKILEDSDKSSNLGEENKDVEIPFDDELKKLDGSILFELARLVIIAWKKQISPTVIRFLLSPEQLEKKQLKKELRRFVNTFSEKSRENLKKRIPSRISDDSEREEYIDNVANYIFRIMSNEDIRKIIGITVDDEEEDIHSSLSENSVMKIPSGVVDHVVFLGLNKISKGIIVDLVSKKDAKQIRSMLLYFVNSFNVQTLTNLVNGGNLKEEVNVNDESELENFKQSLLFEVQRLKDNQIMDYATPHSEKNNRAVSGRKYITKAEKDREVSVEKDISHAKETEPKKTNKPVQQTDIKSSQNSTQNTPDNSKSQPQPEDSSKTKLDSDRTAGGPIQKNSPTEQTKEKNETKILGTKDTAENQDGTQDTEKTEIEIPDKYILKDGKIDTKALYGIVDKKIKELEESRTSLRNEKINLPRVN